MVRVTVLGSGDAFGSGGRLHSAYLVESSAATFLIESGPTVLQGLKRVGCDPARLDFVAVSHLHGDHFGGIPFLFLEYRYESPRTRPFTIYGPPGTTQRVERLSTALYEHIASQPSPYRVDYVELSPGVPCDVQGVRLEPVRVPHTPELVCFAYRITVDGKTLFYSGDTAWTESLVQHARGADLVLCECSTFETQLPIHISYPEIAARAADFGCRRLVLSHLGSETLAHEGTLSLELARDGLVIEL